MKTKDYISQVKSLGFDTVIDDCKIYVFEVERGYDFKKGDYLLNTSIDFHDVQFKEFYMRTSKRIKLVSITMEYFNTAMENRGSLEEPKFYLRRNIPLLNGPAEYFKVRVDDGIGFTTETVDLYNPNLYMNLFTQAELDLMDITGFKPIPEEDVKK